MTSEQRNAILELAKEFIRKVNTLDGDFFSTVVITHHADATVIGNDNPINALAALSHGFNDAAVSAIDMENFIYSDTTRH